MPVRRLGRSQPMKYEGGVCVCVCVCVCVPVRSVGRPSNTGRMWPGRSLGRAVVNSSPLARSRTMVMNGANGCAKPQFVLGGGHSGHARSAAHTPNMRGCGGSCRLTYPFPPLPSLLLLLPLFPPLPPLHSLATGRGRVELTKSSDFPHSVMFCHVVFGCTRLA